MQQLASDIPLMLSFALFLGIVSQLVARAVNVPGIVILLITGAVFGPDCLGLVNPALLGNHLKTIVGAAVAIILFEGGLQLQIASVRKNQKIIRRLVTTGAVLTALGASALAHWILGWNWSLSVLFGTLVIVTGPTVVSPLLKRIRLRKDLQTILLAEGVLIDPIGAIIAVIAFDVVISGSAIGAATGVFDVFFRLSFGIAVGASGGAVLTWILRRPFLVPDDFANIVTLSFVLLLFHASNLIFHESGIMTATIAGMVVGNVRLPNRRTMFEFKEQLTHLLIGLLFILLTASTRLSDVVSLGWRGAATVLGVMFLVRPLVVLWSASGSGLPKRKQLFMAWLAPRGIVAAAVASIFTARLDAMGVKGGGELQALVFMVIAATVLIQGTTADLLAGLLKVRIPRDRGYVFIGANAFARALGQILVDADEDVVMIDKNPAVSSAAENAGFRVIFGNAMDAKILRRAHVNTRRAVLALTDNEGVNLEALRKARQLSRDVSLHMVQRAQDIDAQTLRAINSTEAFGGPVDVAYWSQLLERNQATFFTFSLEKADAELKNKAIWKDRTFDMVPIAMTVNKMTQPFIAGNLDGSANSQITVLAHHAAENDIQKEFKANGWAFINSSSAYCRLDT